jgi:hypothetical protein
LCVTITPLLLSDKSFLQWSLLFYVLVPNFASRGFV